MSAATRRLFFSEQGNTKVNGYYDADNNTIGINAKSTRAVERVLSHELTHHLEGSEFHESLTEYVWKMYDRNGIDSNEAVAEMQGRLRRAGAEFDEAAAEREIVAEWVERNLFGANDEAVRRNVKNLVKENRTLAERLRDAVVSLWERITGAEVGGVPRRDLRKLREALRLALEEKNETSGGGVAFSIAGTSPDGTRMYETDFAPDMTEKEKQEAFRSRVSTVFNLGAVELKTDIKKIVVKGDKFTATKNIYGDENASSEERNAKRDSLYDMADILENSVFMSRGIEPSYENKDVPPKNKAHEGVKYWYKFKTGINLDGKGYDVTFNIRDKGAGGQYAYLVEFKRNEKLDISHTSKGLRLTLQASRYDEKLDINHTSKGLGSTLQASRSDNSISEGEEKINPKGENVTKLKFSLADSATRESGEASTLTEDEMRLANPAEDADGNLIFEPNEASLFATAPAESEYDINTLKQDNELLSEKIKRLESQFKRTPKGIPDESSVRKFARDILKSFDSKYDTEDAADRIADLYRRLQDKDSSGTMALTFDAAFGIAHDIAEDIVSASSSKNDILYNEYAELRSYLRNTKMRLDEANRADFDSEGGYEAFRKRYFGRIALSNEGTPIETIYAELCELYPEQFSVETINPADMLKRIGEVSDKLRPVYENKFETSGYYSAAVDALAGDIIERVREIGEAKPTFADRAEKRREKSLTELRETFGVALRREREKAEQKLYDKVMHERDKAKASAHRQSERYERRMDEMSEAARSSAQKQAERYEKRIAEIKSAYRAREEARKRREEEAKAYREKRAIMRGKYIALPEIRAALADGTYAERIKPMHDKINELSDRLEALNYQRDRSVAKIPELEDEIRKYGTQLDNALAYLSVCNRIIRETKNEEARAVLGDIMQFTDKKTGLQYATETLERNIRDISSDKERAEVINEHLSKPVKHNEAERQRKIKALRERVKGFGISQKLVKGNANTESEAVQLVAEADYMISILREGQKSYGRLTREDWQAKLDNFIAANPKLDFAEVRRKAGEMQKIYDELYAELNKILLENGYPPIRYRKGYFPHFSENAPDSALAKAGAYFGIDATADALPTSINGLTHMYKPGKRWFGHSLRRKTDSTDYDALEGFERYIEGATDIIYHTADIGRVRAMSRVIRLDTADSELRERAEAILKSRDYATDADRDAAIEALFSKGRYKLSRFVSYLDEYANLLANKKSKHDRSMEELLGRSAYNFFRKLEGHVGANMVSLNVGSAATNLIPLHQAAAQISPLYIVKGMRHTLAIAMEKDGISDLSDFLVSRRGSNPLTMTGLERASAVSGALMEAVDGFVSGTIVRARYFENMAKNPTMSESAAIAEADAFAASVMADRSKGATPTLFATKSPLVKAFTQFQLEPNNTMRHIFKDLPREELEKGVGALVGALIRLAVGSYIFNDMYEFFIGRRPDIDVLGMINDALGRATGKKLPNFLGLIASAIRGDLTGDIFDTKREGISDALGKLGEDILEASPFVGNLTGGGRLPVTEAFPDIPAVSSALIGAAEGEIGGLKAGDTVYREFVKPLMYATLPFGAGQLMKTGEGVLANLEGGSYSITNEGERKLQYPIINDTPGQTVLNYATSAIFGKSSTTGGREWIAKGFGTRSVKETSLYRELISEGESSEAAYNVLDAMKNAGTDAEKQAALRDYKGLSEEGKAVVFETMIANDREGELLAAYEGDRGEIYSVLSDVRDAKTEDRSSRAMAQISAVSNSSLPDVVKARTFYAAVANERERALMDELEKQDDVDIEDVYEVLIGINRAGDNRAAKYEAVAMSEALTEAEKRRVMRDIMTESAYEKLETASRRGVKVGSWAKFTKALAAVSPDGRTSQKEAAQALDTISIPRIQKAVIWQLQNKSWSAESNPYDAKIGALIKAEME